MPLKTRFEVTEATGHKVRDYNDLVSWRAGGATRRRLSAQAAARGPELDGEVTHDFVTRSIAPPRRWIRLIMREAPDRPSWAKSCRPSGRRRRARLIVDPLDGTTNFLHGYPRRGQHRCLVDASSRG